MLSSSMRLLRRKGFTLVEMLVTVSILVILIAIAMPNFQTFVLNTKIRSTAESLLTGINLARAEAIRRNTRVSLWLVNGLNASCSPSTSGAAWVVSLDAPNDACNAQASDTVAPRLIQARHAYEAGGNVKVAAVDGSCLTFNSFGGLDTQCINSATLLSTIDIEADNDVQARKLRIVISTGGSARLCDPAITNTNDPASCGNNNENTN